MSTKRLSRRDFLRLSGILTAGLMVTSCKQTATETEMPEPTAKPDDMETAPTATSPPPTDVPLPEVAPGVPGVAREDTLIFAFSYGAPLPVNQNIGYMSSQNGNAVSLEPLFFYNPHDCENPLVPCIADGPYV